MKTKSGLFGLSVGLLAVAGTWAVSHAQDTVEKKHATKMPAELSGGMVKRVALARALALEPELLFLDEPTAGLDPDRSESFVQLLRSLHRELCLTVIMVTHDLAEAERLADRTVRMNAGRVI